MTEQPLIEQSEAMELLDCKRTHLYRLRTSGLLPWVPQGDGPRPRVKFKPEDIAKFMKSRTTPPTTERKTA